MDWGLEVGRVTKVWVMGRGYVVQVYRLQAAGHKLQAAGKHDWLWSAGHDCGLHVYRLQALHFGVS